MRIKFILLLFWLVMLGLNSATYAQFVQPKAGEYMCYSFTTKTVPKMMWVLNPITNQLEMRLGFGVDSNLLPAPFGLVLDSKNSYLMTKTKGKGTYSHSAKTGDLVFTGDITFLNVVSYSNGKNGEYVINFSDKKSGVPYVCQLGGKPKDSTSNQPPPTQPTSQKIKQNPLATYIPSKGKESPELTKAFEIYGQVMADDLENLHDVAAALAYIIGFNYMIYNSKDSIPPYQVQKIYDQFMEKLLLDENFKNSSNEIKQEMTEKIVLDGLQTREAQFAFMISERKEICLKILKKYLGDSADKLKITDNGMEF